MSTNTTKKNRTRYFANWATIKRLELIEKLGGKCELCFKKTNLEFDHPNGRDWRPEKKSRWMRMIIYAREAAAGLIRLLCKGCNKKTGGGFRYGYRRD